MAEDIQALFDKKISPPKFERNTGLFGATTLGVGALMGAGIYVLIGVAANQAGPSVILTYLITGILAFFTTLMYSELSKIIPRAGGGYTYSYDILGSFGGFTTGWFLALGSVFASALYAIGFAEYAVSLLGSTLPSYISRSFAVIVTLLIGILFLFSSGGSKKGNSFQTWVVWGNVGILLILIVLSFFHLNDQNITPVFPKGWSGTFSAISIIYISFFGYQLIANNADEIISPDKTIPKAMKLSMLISITIYLLIAFAAVMTVPWQTLAQSKAPLVLVADKIFGGKGWIVISLGGVLASLGALSSTVLSQSRQTYVMGKDRFFPDVLGKLSDKTKQPIAALIAGVVLVSLVLIFFNLEFIAKAANFCLLFSLLPVSLAMRKIYKKNPELKPKARWKHYLPQITFVINIGLLLTLDIVSLAFGQQLAIIGLVVYFLYSRKREKSGREGLNIILESNKKFSFFTRNKVLVPMSNPDTQRALLTLSNTLMAKKGGEIVVLAIKNTPSEMNFYDALTEAGPSLDVIKRGITLAKDFNINVKPIIRASRETYAGIVNVAQEEKSDLIILGFPPVPKDDQPSIASQVIAAAANDILILNLKHELESFKPKKIALYVHDLKHMHLMLMSATAIAEKYNSKIVLLGYLPEDYSKRQKSKADKMILASLENLNSTALYDISLIQSNDPKEDLINRSKEFDLLIVGKETENSAPKNMEKSDAFQIARNAECSVIMVKTVNTLKKLIRRL
ncbi:MAG: amino acid permease [Bacteroidales bacterium]|nr:amino acid permease [Bacteroidales bacterium]